MKKPKTQGLELTNQQHFNNSKFSAKAQQEKKKNVVDMINNSNSKKAPLWLPKLMQI